jgi:hypothetical protein
MYQALETEIGGQLVYEAAIECAVNDDLRQEWGKYLDEPRMHETILRETFSRIGLDPQQETPAQSTHRPRRDVCGAEHDRPCPGADRDAEGRHPRDARVRR